MRKKGRAACCAVLWLGALGCSRADVANPPAPAVVTDGTPVVWEQGSAALRLQVHQDGGYSVLRAGQEWLTGAPTAVHCGSQWYSTQPVSGQQVLRLVNTQFAAGRDALGVYTGDQITWDAGGTPFVTAFRIYDNKDRIVFTQSFPKGATGTAIPPGDSSAALSAFPSFQTAGKAQTLHTLTYQGTFAGPQRGLGLLAFSGGTDGGVPLVLSDEASHSLVLSPLNRFKDGVQTRSPDVGGALDCGVQGQITSLPGGFALQTILTAGPGVTDSLYAWGSDLLAYSGKPRTGPAHDPTVTHLGYWTDNGSFYYYLTEPGKDYETTMLDLRASHARSGLPFAYYQLDSWWYYKGKDGGVDRWEARPEVFPDGVGGFHAKLGLPLVLHNRWWSPATAYASQYPFVVDEKSAVPTQRPFWDYLLAKNKQEGALVYEQDWLVDQYHRAAALRRDPDAAGDWLGNMGRAAGANDMTVQYCMPLPADLLQSTQIPAVTQTRVSGDYHPGSSQWRIGATSLLAWSLGLAPFKDTFWTTANEPGSPYGAKTREPNTQLETLVSALSAGPIGPGDKLGLTNVALLMKTCRHDGLLLKPDKPATPIDRWFLGDIPGDVWDANTSLGANRWHFVLAAGLTSPITLSAGDLSAAGRYVAFNPDAGTVTAFDASHPVPLSSAPRGPNAVPFTYLIFAPQTSKGWAFLGETSKFVTVSPQRFADISSDGLRLTLLGSPGEPVIVQWSAPASPLHVTVSNQSAPQFPPGQTPPPTMPNGWNYDDKRHILTGFVTIPQNGGATVQVQP